MKFTSALLSLIVCFCASLLVAASQPGVATKTQELVLAYAAADANTDLIVILRNNLPDSALAVRPVLRGMNGAEIEGEALTLRAREVRHVPLPLLFRGIGDDSGQLLLRFSSAQADNLAASIAFRRAGREVQPPVAGLDTSTLGKQAESHVVWMLPNPDAHVDLAFTNTTANAVSAMVNGVQQVTLGPWATVRLPITDAGTTGTTIILAPDTVRVTTVVAGGAIASTFMRRQHPSNQTASRRPVDISPVVSLHSGPVAPGPCSTGVPYSVLLHNLSDAPVTARAVLKEYRNSVSSPIGQLSVKIAPGQTVTADFQAKASGPASAWHAVDVEYLGDFGDLAGVVLARKQAGVETQPLSASAAGSFVGTRWLSAAAASTGIRIANPGRKPVEYRITFFAPDSSILYQLKGPQLKPGEDTLVDVAQLREQRIPDPQSRIMPATLEEGTFEVEVPDASGGMLFAAAATPAASPDAMPNSIFTLCCGRMDPVLTPDPWNAHIADAGWEVPSVRNTCTDAYVSPSEAWFDDYIGTVISLEPSGMRAFVTALAPGNALMSATVATYLGGLRCGELYYQNVQAQANVAPITISGPNTVWWFNGLSVSGYPVQITLTAASSGTVTWRASGAKAGAVSLNSSGNSVTITATGSTFSEGIGDVAIIATANAVDSDPYGITVKTAVKWDTNALNSGCVDQTTPGWHHTIHYTLKDNFNSVMPYVDVNEGFSGATVWPQPASEGSPTDSTGVFTDDIFVCQPPNQISPNPVEWDGSDTGPLVDRFSQTWCAGSSVCNVWGVACNGKQFQSGTLKRYTDHGTVTVP
jgi:hypothetical protein